MELARQRLLDGAGATETMRRRRRDGDGATETARRRRCDGDGATETVRRRRRDGAGATKIAATEATAWLNRGEKSTVNLGFCVFSSERKDALTVLI